MRLAWELARREFQRYSSYRTATAAGLITNTVFGFLRGAVFLAALEAAGTGRIAGYDRAGALTYTWLTQSLLAVVAVWGWNDIAVRIQTGEIATDLLRPYDFQTWWLARDLGRGAYQVLARGVTPLLVGATVFALSFPSSATRWIAFAFSVVCAVVVSFGLRFLMNMWVFWTMDWRGASSVHNALMSIMSGLLLPVALFPDAIAQTMRALPWYQTIQAPIDVFLGRGAMPEVLARQVVWAIALLVAGKAVMIAAHRRLVVQGG